MAHEMTKKLRFDKKTIQTICERDGMCYFCRMGYHQESKNLFDYQIWDIMHIVPKSSLGLGVEENGVLGCRYHHSLMDNGNQGLRDEMTGMLEQYMKDQYPGWNRQRVIYQKYSFGVAPKGFT